MELRLTARRRRSGIDVYARRGDDTRRLERGMILNASRYPVSNIVFVKANILIDQNGHACLADFGLLTIVSDSTYPTTSSSLRSAGTTRWMSPELLDPDRFGFEDGRPTKASDCYALGMVVLEVLSGQAPFSSYSGLVVMRKVIEGERPGRPQGAEGVWFTDDLWEMLEQCWSPQPKDRPTVEAILERLEQSSAVWQPLPPSSDDGVPSDSDDESDLTTSYHPSMFLSLASYLVLTFKHLLQQVKQSHKTLTPPQPLHPELRILPTGTPGD